MSPSHGHTRTAPGAVLGSQRGPIPAVTPWLVSVNAGCIRPGEARSLTLSPQIQRADEDWNGIQTRACRPPKPTFILHVQAVVRCGRHAFARAWAPWRVHIHIVSGALLKSVLSRGGRALGGTVPAWGRHSSWLLSEPWSPWATPGDTCPVLHCPTVMGPLPQPGAGQSGLDRAPSCQAPGRWRKALGRAGCMLGPGQAQRGRFGGAGRSRHRPFANAEEWK